MTGRTKLRYFQFLKPLLIVFIAAFIIHPSYGQASYLHPSHPWHDFIERLEIKSGEASSSFHSAIKPLDRKALMYFLEQKDTTLQNLSTTDKDIIAHIRQSNAEWSHQPIDSNNRPLLNHFYKIPSDLYHYNSGGLFLVINPVLHLAMGQEKDALHRPFVNTRGVEVRGMIDEKIGFYSYVADNQQRFPTYITHKIENTLESWEGVIPGEGWNIPYGESAYDYFTARGHIAFRATPSIDFQFGQDKNFLGHGHRSLLLSDNSNNYLFLKINTRVGPFHYQNMFARLVDFPLRSFGGREFDRKYMAAHTLSIRLTDRFQIGFFENVVFGRSDTLSQRRFDPHYLNPIIFYRAVEHHIGDPDKVAIGTFWRYIMGRHAAFYGQIYIDDFHVGDIRKDLDQVLVSSGIRSEPKFSEYGSFRNKFGLQTGVTLVDFLTIPNLDVSLEGNWVRPFTYTHFDVDGSGQRPAASYTHYAQALAHPLGANFKEYIFNLQYMITHRWQFGFTIYNIEQGISYNGTNIGADIFETYTSREGDYGHTFLQGQQRKIFFLDFVSSYQFMPNAWVDFRILQRSENTLDLHPDLEETFFFNLALRINSQINDRIF